LTEKETLVSEVPLKRTDLKEKNTFVRKSTHGGVFVMGKLYIKEAKLEVVRFL